MNAKPQAIPMGTAERSERLCEIAELAVNGSAATAAALCRQWLPIDSNHRHRVNFTPSQILEVGLENGFIDYYTGERLWLPAALRLLSRLLPEEFPYHPNWAGGHCHQMYWSHAMTVDHIVPLTRGGSHTLDNWAPTCGRVNMAKGNATLAELNWTPWAKPGALVDWDGMLGWFMRVVGRCTDRPEIRDDAFFKGMLGVAKKTLANQGLTMGDLATGRTAKVYEQTKALRASITAGADREADDA